MLSILYIICYNEFLKGGVIIKNIKLIAAVSGLALNFILFTVKLFIGISSASLSIYCDAINNLGDTFACIVAILGFAVLKKMNERQSDRMQSLCTFVIGIFIAVTGIYFVYNGIERIMYPVPVQYLTKYAVIVAATVFVKIGMGIMYKLFDKKAPSPVIKALALDSFLDSLITVAALMSLVLIQKVNYAVDGIFAVITGSIITVSAIKNIISQSKFLINN